MATANQISFTIEPFVQASGAVAFAPGTGVLQESIAVAADACGVFEMRETFAAQFETLIRHLGGWALERKSSLQSAWLTAREDCLLFVVAQNARKRDVRLEEALTELDVEVANRYDFNLIRLSVLGIPDCSAEQAQSFLSRKMTLGYALHGDGK